MNIKSLLFTLVSVFMIGVAVQAQAAISLEDYTAKNEGWEVNIDKAYEMSQKTGRPILANFTGSDWCGWCIRLDKSVFHTDAFKAWAKDNVILLELDFPRRKQLPVEIRRQNANLQKAFSITGYPTILVFDLSKDEERRYAIAALGKTGYAKTSKEFTDACDRMIAQRKKAE